MHVIALALLAMLGRDADGLVWQATSHSCSTAAVSLSTAVPFVAREGRMARSDTVCLSVQLARGDFVRIAIEADGVDVRLFGPGMSQSFARSTVERFLGEYLYPPLVSFVAPTAGDYVIAMAAIFAAAETRPWIARVDEHRPASVQTTQLHELRDDARTGWLKRNAHAMRPVGIDDNDYSDLAFLRNELKDVRVVMLGESDHGNGSDFRTKARLIRFLHQELGFDVLAFESGLFAMSVAWNAVRAGMDPGPAFRQAAYRVWSLSEQVQPLLHYVAARASTSRPLELAGFDSQLTLNLDRDSLIPRLREFLARSSIPSLFLDSTSTPSRALQSLVERRWPTDSAWDVFKPALHATAAEVDRISTREALFWAQVLRSTANPGGQGRDRQMAENLLWLLERHYAGRKVIVWAHNIHVMRNPQHTRTGRAYGVPMGHFVWERLGRQAFAVGFTSFQGTTHRAHRPLEEHHSIVLDQHSEAELEELLDAAGHRIAWLGFRKRQSGGAWVEGSFLARPNFHNTERAPWSQVFDALIFVRDQEPSRATAGGR